MPRSLRALAIASLTLTSLLAAGPVAAVDPAPANDAIEDAIVIDTFPFTISLSTVGATSAATDPGYCHAPEIGPDQATVWFSWTASADGPIGVTTFGSDYDTTLYVGTANGAGGIDVIGCSDDTRSHESAVRFDAQAGQTYLIMAGGQTWAGLPAEGNLTLTLDVGPAAQDPGLVVDEITFERGEVVVRGSVSCTAETDLGSLVIVEVQQIRGERETGYGVAFVDVPGCPDGAIPFEAVVPNDLGRLHPGPATVQAMYFACNTFECANEVHDLELTIRP